MGIKINDVVIVNYLGLRVNKDVSVENVGKSFTVHRIITDGLLELIDGLGNKIVVTKDQISLVERPSKEAEICGITRLFEFESAHFLRNYHGKCANLHGHSYKLEVSAKGKLNDSGMVIDFTDLKHIVTSLIERLDHRDLNSLFPNMNPTAENLVVWIYNELEVAMPEGVNLVRVKLWETSNSYVEYPV